VACSNPACPAVVKRDCDQWLTEMDASLPSVVVAARDATGRDLVDVRVTIDGTVLTQSWDGTMHPTSYQESKGHGCFNWSGGSFPGGDGVVYYPNRAAGTVPASPNDRNAQYSPVDIFGPGGLWERRNSNPPFASWGAFAGDDGQSNAAHAPWAWDDWDDGSDLQPGVIATDPAYLVSRYFANVGPFSLTYTRNQYRS